MTDSEVLALGEQRVKELGLEVGHFKFPDYAFYQSDDIHRLLGSGVEVLGDESREYPKWEHKNLFTPNHTRTHQALLIGITPIKKATREERMEELLREFIVDYERSDFGVPRFLENGRKAYNAAKALLDEKP